MRIISATVETDDGHQSLDWEQIEEDTPEIERQHEQAMRSDPTWPAFGGVIRIEGRKYQVVDK
jgi:hypothetical protein